MPSSIGAKIALEGEREFRQALKNINTELDYLESSLALTTEKFKGQEGSIEALTAKQKDLQGIYDTQARKVEELQKRLRAASGAYGEFDDRTTRVATQLNKAQLAMFKTGSALDDVNEKIEYSNNTVLKLIDGGLDVLEDKFGITLPKKIQTTAGNFVKLDANMVATIGATTALVAVLVEAEKALIDLTKEQAAYADEVLTTSVVTGISTQRIQEYNYAAELIDVSVDTLTSSQARLIRAMGDAQQGTAAQVEAFEKLGVAYANADGSLRDSEEVFWDVIDSLGEMTNETERDAVAMELLGRSAQDLNPLIKAGRDRMRELADEAHAMGFVLDGEALSALGDVDDALQRLNLQLESVKKQVAAEFAPSMADATTSLSSAIAVVGEALVESGAVESLGILLQLTASLIEPAMKLLDIVVFANGGLQRLFAVLDPILAVLTDIANVISGILSLDFDRIKEGLSFDNTRDWWGDTFGGGSKKSSYSATSWSTGGTSYTSTGGYTGIGTTGGSSTGRTGSTSSGTSTATGGTEVPENARNVQKLGSQTTWEDPSGTKWISGGGTNTQGTFVGNDLYINWDYYKNLQKATSVTTFTPGSTHYGGSFLQLDDKWLSHNAAGHSNFPGGFAWVGENGPEKVYLPRGSRIESAQESRMGETTTIYVTIDAKNVKEFNDIVQIAKTARMRARKK